ncbi:MAG: metallophosphoesterase [Candidatus Hodarchaeota archaeon]
MIFNILALADIHGNVTATKKLVKTVQTEKEKIDLILIAGDLPVTTPPRLMLKYMITHPLRALSKIKYTHWVYKGNGRDKFVEYQLNSTKIILDVLTSLKAPIVYIPGNIDCKEVQVLFKNWDVTEVHYLESASFKLGTVLIIGYGGTEFSPKRYSSPLCDMEFQPKEFRARLAFLQNKKFKNNQDEIRILLSHEPPAFEYASNNNHFHGGSRAITELIDSISPIIAIFGHYHEFQMLRKEEKTIYVNPGPLACYNYALIKIINQEIQVSLKKMNPAHFDFINTIYRYRHPSPNLEHEFRLK